MDRSDIPSLDDLRAFEATARLGSVRLAADALALTPAGATLNLTLGRFFGELAATVHGLRAAGARQSAIVLSCEPSVAVRWLIPRLGQFQAAHPDLAVHLAVGGGAVDFRRNGVDLAIRRLDFALPEAWNVRRPFPERVGPVMRSDLAPAFERGRYLALGAKTRPDAWAQWLQAHPGAPRPTEIRYFDHHSLIVEAASAGLGVALSPYVLAVDEVSRGRLAAPAGFAPDGSHYGLIWPGPGELRGGRQALAAWLQAQCSRLDGAHADDAGPDR